MPKGARHEEIAVGVIRGHSRGTTTGLVGPCST